MKKRDVGGIVLLLLYLLVVGLLTGPSLYQLLVGRLPVPRLELVPFADIIKVLSDKEAVGAGVMANLAGNIVMFLPLGLLLPLFWPYFRRGNRTIVCGFLLSVSIELIQLVAGGVTSVDDVLLNTLGTAAGYVLAMVFLNRRSDTRQQKRHSMAWLCPLGCWLTVILLYTAMDFITLK